MHYSIVTNTHPSKFKPGVEHPCIKGSKWVVQPLPSCRHVYPWALIMAQLNTLEYSATLIIPVAQDVTPLRIGWV